METGLFIVLGLISRRREEAPLALDALEGAAALRSRLQRLESARPRLRVRSASIEQRTIYRNDATHVQAIGRPSVAFVTFVNEPETTVEGAVARAVIAEVDYFSPAGSQLGTMQGLWPISDPARGGMTPNADVPRADFSIGETRKLTVAMKWGNKGSCTAITNGGVMAYHWGSPPEFAITAPVFHVRVRLRGILVDSVFWFEVRNDAPELLAITAVEAPAYVDTVG